jgi:hypothetical protein
LLDRDALEACGGAIDAFTEALEVAVRRNGLAWTAG